MVKGISKQVILVRPQEEALFEQAIFIVRDNVEGITEQALMKQARQAAENVQPRRSRRSWETAAAFGAGAGLTWLLSILF